MRFASATSDERAMFEAFGYASFRAQGFESLLIKNLQYSLVLRRQFKSPSEMDESASRYGVMQMGQVLAALTPLVDDDELLERIQHAIYTRNDLSHHFFRTRKSGEFMSSTEIREAIEWCGAAAAEFATLSLELSDRCQLLAAQVGRDPDAYIPGLGQQLNR